MTKQQLQENLTVAIKARDETKKSVLRMLLSAINYYEIEKGGAGYNATDEDVMSVIEKQVKQRKDSIEQYTSGNRPELAAKESQELELLQVYMPEQMGEEEIRTLVKDAVSQTGATSIQELGKVMGVLMPQVKGKADGGLVSKIVKEELS